MMVQGEIMYWLLLKVKELKKKIGDKLNIEN